MKLNIFNFKFLANKTVQNMKFTYIRRGPTILWYTRWLSISNNVWFSTPYVTLVPIFNKIQRLYRGILWHTNSFFPVNSLEYIYEQHWMYSMSRSKYHTAYLLICLVCHRSTCYGWFSPAAKKSVHSCLSSLQLAVWILTRHMHAFISPIPWPWTNRNINIG